jgi:hypothetical protein
MPDAPRTVAWSWERLALGAAYALPALVVAPADPVRGLTLAIGVLPAATAGSIGPRRARVRVLVVGAVAGVALALGAWAAQVSDAVAVLTVVAVCLGASAATARAPGMLAALVLGLGAPLTAAGLSVPDARTGIEGAVLIVLGSCWAWLVSLALPERPADPHPPRTAPSTAAALGYGAQLALAGGAAVAITLALGLDHPGWAGTSALLVSRPAGAELRARGVERSAAVLAGALLACAVAAADPSSWVLAVLLLAAIGGAAATAGSRRYVTPFFSTLLVLSLLAASDDRAPRHWLVERVGETVLGVALAAGAEWLAARVRSPTSPPPT